MKIVKDIPDGPTGDRTYLALVKFSGHGRPLQLKREIMAALERVLYNEFGNTFKINSLTECAYDYPVLANADIRGAGIPDDISIVVDEPDQRQDDAGNYPRS